MWLYVRKEQQFHFFYSYFLCLKMTRGGFSVVVVVVCLMVLMVMIVYDLVGFIHLSVHSG